MKVKLSFVGDIMCEMEQIKVAHLKNRNYDFIDQFSTIKNTLRDCDFLVGNLETPIAGKELIYTNHIWSFNSPKEFAIAIKNAGFNLVSTANNHCLDRGVVGLEKTIKNLNEIGLEQIGTYIDEHNKPYIKNIGGFKIAFLAYTYGTNAAFNNVYLKNEDFHKVNLFQPQERNLRKYEIGRLFYRHLERSKYLKKLKKEISEIQAEKPDYVIMLMHSGGQHNAKPDNYTQKLTKLILDLGIDAIIGCHPHVIHSCEILPSNQLIAYSLGNFCCTPGTSSSPFDKMSDYSVILNLYLEKQGDQTILEKVTFNVVKNVVDEFKETKIHLVYDLIEQNKQNPMVKMLVDDNCHIYNTITNSQVESVLNEKEYILLRK